MSWNGDLRLRPIFLSVALLVGVLSVPTFLLHSIVRLPENDVASELYTIEFTDFRLLGSCGLFALNLWLTGILFKLATTAACNIVVMLSYTVFIIRFGFAVGVDNPPIGYSFQWACFLLVHLVLSISVHTITLYLGVATAYIRYKSTSKLRCSWNRQSVAR
ncbi:Protein DMSR-5 [Aphelenchoides avenae]|nr:Protein DMSR-5 [Aphelenchus avenae]